MVLDDLRQKGFYVAEDSAANYCQTLLSLAASMNMTYLDSLSQRVGIGSHDRTTLLNAVLDNALARSCRGTVTGLSPSRPATWQPSSSRLTSAFHLPLR